MDYNSAETAHDMRRSRPEAAMFADDAGEVCELPLRSQERTL